MATPKNVKEEDKKLFEDFGYKCVDETQVVRIETEKYFRFLIEMVTSAGQYILYVKLTERTRWTNRVINNRRNFYENRQSPTTLSKIVKIDKIDKIDKNSQDQ